jgi:hypothetical protein
MQRAVKMTTSTAVFLREDFASLGRPSQVSVALKVLQQRGVLARIGTGIYAKTRISSVTGKPVPAGSLETLGVEALEKLGVPVGPSRATIEYNSGKTTQIPGRFVVNTGKRQISRKSRKPNASGLRIFLRPGYCRVSANIDSLQHPHQRSLAKAALIRSCLKSLEAYLRSRGICRAMTMGVAICA